MGDGTAIEWTDATWNVVNGCSVHSAGCTHCFAMKQAHRVEARRGLTQMTNGGMVWTGEVRFNERVLTDPLRWRRPRRIFVCAHGDLFHESVPDEWIDRVFAVMALAPQHQFQVLTKRSTRMRAWFERAATSDGQMHIACAANDPLLFDVVNWPLPNVWLGVSVENQAAANARIPDLLATPAEVRWLSCEPLLGPVSLDDHLLYGPCPNSLDGLSMDPTTGAYECCSRCDWTGIGEKLEVHWVVAGGESGHHARPMHPDWARHLRDQCAAAGVSFLFKQWGEWAPSAEGDRCVDPDGRTMPNVEPHGGNGVGTVRIARVGKKVAGRHLDGVLHDGFPRYDA